MVKVNKKKTKEKMAEEQVKAEKERVEAEKRKKELEEMEKKEKETVKEPEALPAYKINLKKQTDNSNAKMKGASLSLLGGYSSMSGSDEEDED